MGLSGKRIVGNRKGKQNGQYRTRFLHGFAATTLAPGFSCPGLFTHVTIKELALPLKGLKWGPETRNPRKHCRKVIGIKGPW